MNLQSILADIHALEEDLLSESIEEDNPQAR